MINTKFMAMAKTPGFSPLKTRLGHTKGPQFANRFYELSIACVGEVLQSLCLKNTEVRANWLVAEKDAIDDSFWCKTPWVLDSIQLQSQGNLGDRLAHAFETHFVEGEGLGVLGTDLPQLSVSLLERAIHEIQADIDFVVGPARDGGFYLLLSRLPIEATLWKSIVYSESSTRAQLIAKLERLGKVSLLEMLSDVDEEQDLKSALEEIQILKSTDGLLRAQERLLEFLIQSE